MPGKGPPPAMKRTVRPHQPSPPAIPEEISLNNVVVGSNGIVPKAGTCERFPPITVQLDDLVRVKDLGKGVQGTVALYKHKTSGKKYAVKKISLTGKGTDAVKTVAAEVRNVFMEQTPYAIILHNAFLREGHLFLVMEYMDWGNLEELLALCPQLSEPVVSYLAAQIAHALARLHRRQQVAGTREGETKRQIHRDVKPANVMISLCGDVKLADFGVAAGADTIGVMSFVGTQTFMSPERIRGERHGTASDVWSLGVLAAQLLIGRYPFEASAKQFMTLLKEVTTVQSIKLPPGCSPEAQSFVDSCIKQNPAERATAHTLLQHDWIRKYNLPHTLSDASISSLPQGSQLDGDEVDSFSASTRDKDGSPHAAECLGKNEFVSLLEKTKGETNRPAHGSHLGGTPLTAADSSFGSPSEKDSSNSPQRSFLDVKKEELVKQMSTQSAP